LHLSVKIKIETVTEQKAEVPADNKCNQIEKRCEKLTEEAEGLAHGERGCLKRHVEVKAV